MIFYFMFVLHVLFLAVFRKYFHSKLKQHKLCMYGLSLWTTIWGAMSITYFLFW